MLHNLLDDAVNDDSNNNNNILNDSCDANDQIQKSFDNPYEMDNYNEQDNFNEPTDKNKQFYKNYSPFIENSLTLVTSPINKVSDNLLSSSNLSIDIQQQHQMQQKLITRELIKQENVILVNVRD